MFWCFMSSWKTPFQDLLAMHFDFPKSGDVSKKTELLLPILHKNVFKGSLFGKKIHFHNVFSKSC